MHLCQHATSDPQTPRAVASREQLETLCAGRCSRRNIAATADLSPTASERRGPNEIGGGPVDGPTPEVRASRPGHSTPAGSMKKMSGQKLRLTRFPLLLIFSLPPQSQTQFHHHRQRSRPTTSSTKSNVTLTSKLRRDCSRCRRPSLSSKRPLRACQSAPARLQSSSLNEYHQLCQTLDEVFCRLPPSRVRPAELGGDFDFLSANGRVCDRI